MSGLVQELMVMGFPQNRAEKAVFFTKSAGTQQALDWLLEHQEDADIDEPITIDESQLKELTGQGPPMSDEEKLAAVAELRAKIAAKKAEKTAMAEVDELDKEKARREMGQKAAQNSQERREALERMEAAKAKREKEKEKAYLQSLRDKIRQEKEERAKKQGGQSSASESQTSAQSSSSTSAPEAAPVTAPVITPAKPAVEHTECQLQIRLTNGQALKAVFKPNDTIQHVAEWVALNRTDGHGTFVLMTTFPKMVFDTPESLQTSLNDAKLVPRGVLVVTKQ